MVCSEYAYKGIALVEDQELLRTGLDDGTRSGRHAHSKVHEPCRDLGHADDRGGGVRREQPAPVGCHSVSSSMSLDGDPEPSAHECRDALVGCASESRGMSAVCCRAHRDRTRLPRRAQYRQEKEVWANWCGTAAFGVDSPSEQQQTELRQRP